MALDKNFGIVAMPNNLLCPNVATFTSSNEWESTIPFTTVLTVPVSFYATKISLELKKAILVGYCSPTETSSTFRWGSLIIGPVDGGHLLPYIFVYSINDIITVWLVDK